MADGLEWPFRPTCPTARVLAPVTTALTHAQGCHISA
jgi:hypothetical protein